MTAAVEGASRGRTPALRVRHWLAGPQQGWSSVLLLVVMLGATGLAIDEQRWMGVGPGGTSQTGMLPLLMVTAGIVGIVLACSQLGPGWVDLIAALVGTATGLLLAATAISDAPTIPGQLRDLNESLARFLHDVLVTGSRTTETSAFLVTVSALAWTSGIFAAISVFRRSNAMGAIVPLGAMLLLEILAADRPQDLWFVVFAAASLLLVLRLDLEDQRERWARSRIAGGQLVGGLFLRGGAAAIAVMLAGSMLLAAAVSSRSLAAAFPQLDAVVAELVANLDGVVGPANGDGTNGDFPDTRSIASTWQQGNQLVFTADPLDSGPHYWPVAAYDTFDGRRWRRTDTTTQTVAANGDLLGSSVDDVSGREGAYDRVDATITSVSLRGIQLPAPQNPVLLDRAARLELMGDGGTLQVLEASDRLGIGDRYTVSGMEPALSDPDGLTVSELLAPDAAEDDTWLAPLSDVTSAVAGEATIDAARSFRAGQPRGRRDPYHLAFDLQQWFRTDPSFRYDTDLRGLCRGGETTSDCLLRTRVGFCQQYATTMAMMLRALHVPARYVEGYLPGRPAELGTYEVDMSAAHAWVEVWFDSVGWLRFDPTPGGAPSLVDNGQVATDLPVGEPLATDEPFPTGDPDATDPLESFGPLETEPPMESFGPEASAAPGIVTGTSTGVPPAWLLLLAGGTGLVLLAGALGLLWFRRLPGREPERAWRGIVALATRLGMGPRPSQTPYEYTVTLSRVVPAAARDLRVVADAKVEASYAPVRGDRASRPLLDAYRRVRLRLLRLLLRR